ncbi:MAG: ABC transporter substrate-binding protein [Candidatus Tritonobacter lacicola]|nr:ABC transporter substrate-binding protein [Candidatus Tritonobacter lacicola]
MKRLKKIFWLSGTIITLIFCGPVFSVNGADKAKYDAVYGKGESEITIATGSPGALGLLKALAEPFCEENDCSINWVKKGSGASLDFMKSGKCDLVMVHAPEAEEKAIDEGRAAHRTLLGSNEFYIVGPKDDPAKIKDATTAKEAYAKIAKTKAKFFSRGDNSGTYKKEMKIWGFAGIKPSGNWYISTNDFMTPTLLRADRENGYFMTDSSTYIAQKAHLKNIVPIFKGDPVLVNIYHSLIPKPEKYTRRNEEPAKRFIDFVSSPRGQKIIEEFGLKKYGQSLYNNAETTRQRSAEKKSETREKPLGMAVEFVDHAACAHIARSKGWFEEEGIKLKFYDSYITGMALASALSRGDIDVAYICLIPSINAFANARVPLRVISGTHKYGYGLLVDPEKVPAVKDLARPDIRLGCSREGSPLDVLLHKMIKQYDLDEEKILKKVRRMPPPKVLLALKMGQLDAGFCCEQYPTMGEKMGFNVLLTARDLWPNMQGSVVIAREELIREHPEIIAKIVKITQRATQYIHDHPEEAARIVANELRAAGKKILPLRVGKIAGELDITPDVIRKSLMTRMICATDIDPKQVQLTIDYMAKLGYIKKRFDAEDILDLRFLTP